MPQKQKALFNKGILTSYDSYIYQVPKLFLSLPYLILIAWGCCGDGQNFFLWPKCSLLPTV